MSNANKDRIVQHKLAAMFAANSDAVSVSKVYIDMTDDLAAGAVLDELMFWTMPKKSTGKTSLRVFRNGALWLAVRRRDWYERKRLSERQSDTAINKLIALGLVEKDVFIFDGKPTVHLRVIMDKFVELYAAQLESYAKEEGDEELAKDIADLRQMLIPKISIRRLNKCPFHQTVKWNLPNGEMLNLRNGKFINSPYSPETTSVINDDDEENPKNEDEPKDEPEDKPNVFRLYEENIAALTPIAADKLREFEDEYPTAWIEKAIEIAVARNARNLKYIETCLKNMKANGVDWKPPKKAAQSKKGKTTIDEVVDELNEWVEEKERGEK